MPILAHTSSKEPALGTELVSESLIVALRVILLTGAHCVHHSLDKLRTRRHPNRAGRILSRRIPSSSVEAVSGQQGPECSPPTRYKTRIARNFNSCVQNCSTCLVADFLFPAGFYPGGTSLVRHAKENSDEIALCVLVGIRSTRSLKRAPARTHGSTGGTTWTISLASFSMISPLFLSSRDRGSRRLAELCDELWECDITYFQLGIVDAPHE
jgi:hypothetical protein